ncbi:response regulator transcription factor [Limnohabitans lacus]|uniref:Response regulator n=1 Tax=Limnohabitans lacus TaxID=3045173 RepID=A0ABT6X6S7_9BURK|nr:response regulator [Limnohabitans sp. HM2-2]MDI9233803.1 response regulator [Limnohabitans sp. HM2-2]
MSNPVLIDVIDDNPDIRRMLGLVLKAQGYQVRTHESANAFLKSEASSEPSLLILDVRMPGMSGLELYRQLLAQDQKHAVIFMSGESQPHEIAAANSSVPVDFLWKPFSTQQLLQAIDKGIQQLRQAH